MRQIFLFAPTYAVVIICVVLASFCSKKYPQAKKTFRRYTHSNDCYRCTGPGRDNHCNGKRELEPDKAGNSYQEGF